MKNKIMMLGALGATFMIGADVVVLRKPPIVTGVTAEVRDDRDPLTIWNTSGNYGPTNNLFSYRMHDVEVFHINLQTNTVTVDMIGNAVVTGVVNMRCTFTNLMLRVVAEGKTNDVFIKRLGVGCEETTNASVIPSSRLWLNSTVWTNSIPDFIQ